MERPDMRSVGEESGERHERGRVRSLSDEDATAAELGDRELEHADERAGRQVFEDVGAEDAAQASVRQALEVRGRIRLRDLEPLAAAEGDHLGIRIDPARLEPGLPQKTEELAA